MGGKKICKSQVFPQFPSYPTLCPNWDESVLSCLPFKIRHYHCQSHMSPWKIIHNFTRTFNLVINSQITRAAPPVANITCQMFRVKTVYSWSVQLGHMHRFLLVRFHFAQNKVKSSQIHVGCSAQYYCCRFVSRETGFQIMFWHKWRHNNTRLTIKWPIFPALFIPPPPSNPLFFL